jgi:hypothetical protein
MPTVRIKGWQPDTAPPDVPPDLSRLLGEDVEMDAEQIEKAFKRLTSGKSVDVPFDPGDEDMAREMMGKMQALGLQSELLERRRRVPRRAGLTPGLVTYIIAGSFVLVAVTWATLLTAPPVEVLRLPAGLCVVFVVSIFAILRKRRLSLMTEEEREEEDRRQRRIKAWYLVFPLIPIIIGAPWVGLLLLVIGVGGVGCAFLIKWMNRP